MEKEVFSFFDRHIDVTRPILVGLSGGADSSCLLHLLLDWGKAQVTLVHIDHGWRETSALERETIQKQATKLNLPLHWTRLEPHNYKGNLEAESRTDRLAFFRQVAEKTGAQGILLGHHSDDQAETVLKRFLEGASLPFLSGMAPVSFMGALCLMRPLLYTSKKEILSWLDKREISYFQDPTNADTRFLRAKMRGSLFPFLRSSFGKEFDTNICEIAKDANELRAYLDEKIAPYVKEAVVSDWGTYYPSNWPAATLEMDYLMRQACRGFSRYQIALACVLLKNHSANKQIVHGSSQLICDRGQAFFIPQEIPEEKATLNLSKATLNLSEGSASFGKWKVTICLTEVASGMQNHFLDGWKGRLCTSLPVGNYTLGSSMAGMRRQFADGRTKEYQRFLTEKKVPHFLAKRVPVILQEGVIVEDFVTGTPVKSAGPCLQITLNRV